VNFFGMGIVFACSGMFQAMGNTLPALASSTTRLLTFVLPALWLHGRAGFELLDVWHLSVASVFVQAIVSCAGAAPDGHAPGADDGRDDAGVRPGLKARQPEAAARFRSDVEQGRPVVHQLVDRLLDVGQRGVLCRPSSDRRAPTASSAWRVP